jgi:hypothetical protein
LTKRGPKILDHLRALGIFDLNVRAALACMIHCNGVCHQSIVAPISHFVNFVNRINPEQPALYSNPLQPA